MWASKEKNKKRSAYNEEINPIDFQLCFSRRKEKKFLAEQFSGEEFLKIENLSEKCNNGVIISELWIQMCACDACRFEILVSTSIDLLSIKIA